MTEFIRRPDFQAIYPTRASFEQATDLLESSTPAEVSPQPDVSTDSLPDDFAILRLRPGFSLRASCAEILGRLEARIVSEHEGLIDTLLITVPKYECPRGSADVVSPRLKRHFKHLLHTFCSDDVRFVIVASPCQRAEVESWCADANVPSTRMTFVSSPRFRYSHWAQDAFVVLRDRFDQLNLCEGVSFPRFEDMTVADDVARQAGMIAVASHLFFQGGNVLGGEKLTLVGRDYVMWNCTRHGMPNEADARTALEELFGTEIVVLGGTRVQDYGMRTRGILSGLGWQPIFHIDMYVTRTGVTDKQSGKEIVFLGCPGKAKEITTHYSDVKELDDGTYGEFFEETKEQLSAIFKVLPLPLWITYGNLNTSKPKRRYYNLTWNNALVEDGGEGKRRVLLPNYADPQDADQFCVDVGIRNALQAAAAQAWEEIGYEVRFTDGMEDLAWGDGAVHCLTKVLRRRPAADGGTATAVTKEGAGANNAVRGRAVSRLRGVAPSSPRGAERQSLRHTSQTLP